MWRGQGRKLHDFTIRTKRFFPFKKHYINTRLSMENFYVLEKDKTENLTGSKQLLIMFAALY